MSGHEHVAAIVVFNDNNYKVFESTIPIPKGAKSILILVDLSGSMYKVQTLLRGVLGAVIAGTNAEGFVAELEPQGGTAMIQAFLDNATLFKDVEVWILTDGYENRFRGKLPVAGDTFIDLTTADYNSDEYLMGVSNWLTYTFFNSTSYIGPVDNL